ncbi:hypothetical protein NE237_027658 [Protea cynaroides]|uniref:Uncharacterized protein n=1 Tax=Protea cynaroides TaxID=273540 RepID=A0A9Q0GMY0_9MAGN|nr:hypothetical protein NE237_027658 [Protea cynaroides]
MCATGGVRRELIGIERGFSTYSEDPELEEFLDYLDRLKNYEKSGIPKGAGTDSSHGFDLRRMNRLMERLGNPQSSFKAVHIAGTKGKGSTAAFLSNILREEGYSVGCYTSPHLWTIRERISLGREGDPVSAKKLNDLFHRIKQIIDQSIELENGSISHFEVLTAMAFALFAQEKVDIAVVEAGLGGARDATNVFSSLGLAASVITTIGEEHLAALGGSLKSIAMAKSGIIKHGRPLVLGGPFIPYIERILLDKASSMSSPVVLASDAGNRSTVEGIGRDKGKPYQLCDIVIQIKKDLQLFVELLDVKLCMLGHHQLQNAVTATCTALCLRDQGWTLSDESIRAGLERTYLLGRSQFLTSEELEAVGLPGLTVLLDGAHTKESAKTLADIVHMTHPHAPLALVVAMASDKDHLAFARELLSAIHPEVVVTTEVSIAGAGSRTTSASLLKDAWIQASMELGTGFVDIGSRDYMKFLENHTGCSVGASKHEPVLAAVNSVEDAMKAANRILRMRAGDQSGVIIVTGSLHVVSSILSYLHRNLLFLRAPLAFLLLVCLCFSSFGLLDMAEGTELRVVRCPKCENLLPELPDYTVYQCGGCGAVLRAKIQTSANDGTSGKSDEVRIMPKGDSEKLERFSNEGATNLCDTSGTDRESDSPELERRRQRPERAANSNATSSSFSSMTGFREVVSDNNGGIDTMVGKETKYRYPSKTPAEDWVVVNDQEINLKRDELAKAQMEKEVGEVLKSQTASARGPLGSGQIPDKRGSERESMAFRRTPELEVDDFRFSTPRYLDEGPSNYHRGSSYGYGKPRKYQSNVDGPSRVEYLEQDRAELLRKLDELKDQLSRSCDMADKPKEGVHVDRRTVLPPPDPYGGHGVWLPEGLPGPSRASMPSFAPDKHVPRTPYFSHGHESIPLMNRHRVDMQQNFHPPFPTPNEIPGYGGEPFGPQMLRRAPHQPPHQYPQQPSHEYFPGHYADIDTDPLAVYPHNSFFDQAICSCLHCYNKHWQVPGQIPPPVYSNRRYPDIPTSSMLNHLENSVPVGSQGYNPRAFNLPVYSREPPNHARRPSLFDSDMGGFNRGRPQRVVVANGNRHRSRPIAGGAPFITCLNCFELLRLPKKLLLMERNECKVLCGACSTVIPIVVENKRLLVSVPDETRQTHPELPGGSNEVLKGLSRHNGYTNEASMNSSDDDYDNLDYFKFTDAEHALLAEDQRLNLSESAKVHGLLSSSSPSEDEESPDSVITRGEMSNTAKQPLRANVTPLVPGSPLRGHPGHVVSKLERGSRSKRLDQEKVVLNKVTLRQDSLKDASVATEMEVSFNEYSNTLMSQNSGEASKEEDQPRVSKGGESFFAGLIKKSFWDFSRSSQTVENGNANVSINGHPIPDRLLRKAEKLAGPIQPGQYWYDFRAGFWGVIGQPCLGIIPPFIEEFNYPMPQNCAGGNTGVFVNGRELQQKDLDLLAGRGLPTTRDKSYIVEISGQVLDEDSMEELDSLGKLAPTIEKVKHGFGMRVPRVDV